MNSMRIAFALWVCVVLLGCGHDISPKPKAYPRVVFPEKNYQLVDPAGCPFRFELPVYARADRDTVFFGEAPENPCWMNIQFPDFNGTINITYKSISGAESFANMLDDAHKLSFKHAKKADFIDEARVQNAQGVSGIIFEAGGEAASNFQFFLTDSSRHFIRGALYFNNEPNADSMAPVYRFVRQDLDRLISTFSWK